MICVRRPSRLASFMRPLYRIAGAHRAGPVVFRDSVLPSCETHQEITRVRRRHGAFIGCLVAGLAEHGDGATHCSIRASKNRAAYICTTLTARYRPRCPSNPGRASPATVHYRCWQLRLRRPGPRRQVADTYLGHHLPEFRIIALRQAERVPAILLPDPLPTRKDALSAELEGLPIALSLPSLRGKLTQRERPRSIAPLRAGSRRCIAPRRSSRNFPLRREAFELAWEPDLRRFLEVAARPEATARPGLVALRAWVNEHGLDMLTQLERLHALQPQVLAINAPLVLCHTDLHGNNVLRTPSGEVYLLDWDDAKLAPPEHDLWIALGEHAVGGDAATVRAFCEAYWDAGGCAPFHPEHFRLLPAAQVPRGRTISFGRLLAADADRRDDEDLLHAIDEWGATRWRHLDNTLAVVAAALA